MAWITPVTDRTSGSAMMTYEDMIRITGNIGYLYDLCRSEGITIAGSRISKTAWTRDDIIYKSNWTNLLTCLKNARDAVGYVATDPTYLMTWDNINEVERQTQAVYTIIEAYESLPRINHWIGDPYYAGDAINAGGRYE